MYNSQNLPLEKRKIIKKSLGAIIGSLALSTFASIMLFIVLYSINQGVNQGYSSFFWALFTFILINVIFAGSVIFYQYLYYRFYYYNFEEDKAEIKKGVVANATGHVRYERIQNIYIDQDVWDRIFGLYDVHYETAGETSGFYSHVDGLSKENADKLVVFLNERVKGKGNTQNINQAQQIQPVNEQYIAEDNDQKISRENLPIDGKIVAINSIVMSIIYSVTFLFVFTRIFFEIANEFKMSLFMFLVISIILIFLFSYIYTKIWYNNFYFEFDKDGGKIKESVIASSEKHVYYDRIQNINITQGFIDRIFGLNKIVIETASEGTKVKSLSVPGLSKENAEILRDFLLNKSKRYRSV